MDLIFFLEKTDDTAILDETFEVPDREDAPAFQAREDGLDPFTFGGADEQDLAIPDVLDAGVALDDKRMTFHLLAFYGLIQEIPKGSSPRIPMRNGSPGFLKVCGGHLMNCAKLKRKTAL